MAVIAQRTMERMRNEMFEKMQGLPIRYFDSHEYGDIMSLYTNDVDTLRQMMMQTFTAAVSSFFTIITVFFSMLSLSVWLTLLMVVSVFFIGKVAAMIAMKSGPYFMQQQQTLAALDGYVEEIINGLKVVKVFSYEGKAMANMSEKNVAWREASRLANGHATAMMPIMNGLGYMQFIIVALIGAALATSAAPNLSLTGINVMTVGMIASSPWPATLACQSPSSPAKSIRLLLPLPGQHVSLHCWTNRRKWTKATSFLCMPAKAQTASSKKATPAPVFGHGSA